MHSSLFIDVGNSFIKAGFYTNQTWEVHSFLHQQIISKQQSGLADWLKSNLNADAKIYAAGVRKDILVQLKKICNQYQFFQVSVGSFVPSMLNYQTTETLGIDRFLVCYAAHFISKKSVIVIDAGTACTIDLMDENGVYQGGIIMPGLSLMDNIFDEKAPELPNVEIEIPKSWPGKSTKESLQWGKMGLLVDGIEAAIQRFTRDFESAEVFITGGDAEKINSLMKNPFRLDKNLVLEALKIYSEGKN